MDKPTLRKLAISNRQALSKVDRQQHSSLISEKLIQHLEIHATNIEALLSYRAMPSEVNADSLFESTRYPIFAPVTHHHEHMQWHRITETTRWQRGLFGVEEPQGGELWQTGSSTTILICPLTGFDRRGNRLGLGKGCFDYWLAEHRRYLQAIIGLAFSCQEMDAIPAEPHDIPMDIVITEREVIPCLNP